MTVAAPLGWSSMSARAEAVVAALSEGWASTTVHAVACAVVSSIFDFRTAGGLGAYPPILFGTKGPCASTSEGRQSDVSPRPGKTAGRRGLFTASFHGTMGPEPPKKRMTTLITESRREASRSRRPSSPTGPATVRRQLCTVLGAAREARHTIHTSRRSVATHTAGQQTTLPARPSVAVTPAAVRMS